MRVESIHASRHSATAPERGVDGTALLLAPLGVAAAGTVAYARRRPVAFIVQMREQADLTAVAALPRGPERRSAVWQALRGVAETSQRPVRATLDRLVRERVIAGYEPLELANSIIVHTTPAGRSRFLTAMQRFDEAARVVPDYQPPLHEMAKVKTVDALLKLVNGIYIGAGRAFRPPKEPWHLQRVGIPETRAGGLDGRGVTIGMLDSGLHPSHGELRAYRGSAGNHDFAWLDPFGRHARPHDPYGHGTHVAGVLVSDRFGAAPKAELIVARAVKSHAPEAWPQLKSMNWMLAPTRIDGTGADPRRGADIISGSIHTAARETDDVVAVATGQLHDAGVTPVFAAGNSGTSKDAIKAPARTPHTIAVAATDHADNVASFSSVGERASRLEGRSWPAVDVAAPGVSIPSTLPHNSWGVRDGTSMATPLVAGSLALVQQRFPHLGPAELRRIAMASAHDIGSPGIDAAAGGGRIDVPAALRLAHSSG